MCSGAIDHVALSAHGFCRHARALPRLRRTLSRAERAGFSHLAALHLRSERHSVRAELPCSAEERPDVAIDPENFLEAGSEWFDPEAYARFETA